MLEIVTTTIAARAMPDTRHTIIGQEVDIRSPIEETSIIIGGISDTIDGTGDETLDTTAILAAIKQVTHSGERQAKFRLGALVDGCCRWRAMIGLPQFIRSIEASPGLFVSPRGFAKDPKKSRADLEI